MKLESYIRLLQYIFAFISFVASTIFVGLWFISKNAYSLVISSVYLILGMWFSNGSLEKKLDKKFGKEWRKREV